MDAEADIPEPIPNLLNGSIERPINTQVEKNLTKFVKPVSEGHLQISDSTCSLASVSGTVEKNHSEEACKTLEVSESNESTQIPAEKKTLEDKDKVENDDVIRVSKATDDVIEKGIFTAEEENRSNTVQENGSLKSVEVQECTDTIEIPEKIEEQLQGDDSAQLCPPLESSEELTKGSKVETDTVSTSEEKGKGDLHKDEVDKEISPESTADIPVCNTGYDKTVADNILDSQDSPLEMERKDELSEQALASSEDKVADLKAEAGNKRNKNLDGESKKQTVDTLDISLEQKQQVSPDGEASSFKEAEAEVDQACHTREPGKILEEFKHHESKKNSVAEDGLANSFKEAMTLTAETVGLKTHNETTNDVNESNEEHHVLVDALIRHDQAHDGEASSFKEAQAVVDQACHTRYIEDEQGKILEEFKHEESKQNLVAEDCDEAHKLADSVKEALTPTEAESADLKTCNETTNGADGNNGEQHVLVDPSIGQTKAYEGNKKLVEAITGGVENTMQDETEPIAMQNKSLSHIFPAEKPEVEMAETPDEAERNGDWQPNNVYQDSPKEDNDVSENEKAAEQNGAANDKCSSSQLKKSSSCQECKVIDSMDEKLEIPSEAKREDKEWAVKMVGADSNDKEICQNTNEPKHIETGQLTNDGVTGKSFEQPSGTGDENLAKPLADIMFEDNYSAASSGCAEQNSKSEGQERQEEFQETVEEKLLQTAANGEIIIAEEKVQDHVEIISSNGTIQGQVMQATTAQSSSESVEENLAEGVRDDLIHAYMSSKEGSREIIETDPENDTSEELGEEFPLEGFQDMNKLDSAAVETVACDTYQTDESPKALQSDNHDENIVENRELESEEDLREMEQHELQGKLEQTLLVTAEETKLVRSSNSGIEVDNIQNQDQIEQNAEKLSGRGSVDCIPDIASQMEDLNVQSLQIPTLCKTTDSTTTETETKAVVGKLTYRDSSNEKSEEEIIKEEIKEVYPSHEIDGASDESVKEDLSEGFEEGKGKDKHDATIIQTTDDDTKEVHQADDCRENEIRTADDHQKADLMDGLTCTPDEWKQKVDEEREKIEYTQEMREVSKNVETETSLVAQIQDGALIQEEKFSETSPNDYEEEHVDMEKQMHENFVTSDQVLKIQQDTEQNSNEIIQAPVLCEEEPEIIKESCDGTKAELIMEKGSSTHKAILEPVSDLQADEEEAGDLVTEEAEEETDEEKEKPASTYTTGCDELKGAEEKNIIQESRNCATSIAMSMVDKPMGTSSSNSNLNDKSDCSQTKSSEEFPSDQTAEFQTKDVWQSQAQHLIMMLGQGTSTTSEDAGIKMPNEDKSTKESERRVEQNSETVGITSKQWITLASDGGQENEVPNKEDGGSGTKNYEDDEDSLKIAHSTEALIQKPEIEDVKEPEETHSADVPEDEMAENVTNTSEEMHEFGEPMEKFDQTQEKIKCSNENTEIPASTETMITKEGNPTHFGVIREQEPTKVKKEMHGDPSDSRQMPEVAENTKLKGDEVNKVVILSEEINKGAEKVSSNKDFEEHTREERNILEYMASETDMPVNKISNLEHGQNQNWTETTKLHGTNKTCMEADNAQQDDNFLDQTEMEGKQTIEEGKAIVVMSRNQITEASDEAQESEVQDFSIDKQFLTPSFEQLSETVEHTLATGVLETECQKIHGEDIMNDNSPKIQPGDEIDESISSQNQRPTDLGVAPRGNVANADLFTMAEKQLKQTQHTSHELPPKEQKIEMNETAEEEIKEAHKLVNEGPEDASGGDRNTTEEAWMETDRIQEHAAAMEDKSASRPACPVEKVDEQTPSSTSLLSTEILEDECSKNKTSEISGKTEEKTKETQKLIYEGLEDASGVNRSRPAEAGLYANRIQEQAAAVEDESASMSTHPVEKIQESFLALECRTAAEDESFHIQVLPVVELLEKKILTVENPLETKRVEEEKLHEERGRKFSIEKKIPELLLQEDKDNISAAQTCSDNQLEKELHITPSESGEDMVHCKMTVTNHVEEKKPAEEWQVAEINRTGNLDERLTELGEVKTTDIHTSRQPELEKPVQTPTLALPSMEDLPNKTVDEKVNKETKEPELLENKNRKPSAAAIETTEPVQLHEVLHELEAVEKDESATLTSSATDEQILPSLVIPLKSTETVNQSMTSIDAIEDKQEKDALKKRKNKFGEQNVAPAIKTYACLGELECDSEVQILEEDHVAGKTNSNFGRNHREDEQNEIAENRTSNVEVREALEKSSSPSGPGAIKDIYHEKLETPENEVFDGTQSIRGNNNTDLKIADLTKSTEIPETDYVAQEKLRAEGNEDLSSEAPQSEGSKGIAGGYEKIHHEAENASDVTFYRQNSGATQPTEITTTVIPAVSEPLPLEKLNVLEETIKEIKLTGGNEDNNSSEVTKPALEGKEKIQNLKEETIVSTLMGAETPSLSDLLQRCTKERLETGAQVEPNENKETEHTKETAEGEKIEEEENDEQEGDEPQQADSSSDAPVILDVVNKDTKVSPKKSHNILSGVGSKVKHSISKVKKAITGKSSHATPASPKGKDFKE